MLLVYVMQRAEDETARLYAEFLESFQGDDAPGLKAFVRGGTVNDEKVKPDTGQFVNRTLCVLFSFVLQLLSHLEFFFFFLCTYMDNE